MALPFDPETLDSAARRVGFALERVWDYQGLQDCILRGCDGVDRPGMYRRHVFDLGTAEHQLRLIVATGQKEEIPFIHVQANATYDLQMGLLLWWVNRLGVAVPSVGQIEAMRVRDTWHVFWPLP